MEVQKITYTLKLSASVRAPASRERWIIRLGSGARMLIRTKRFRPGRQTHTHAPTSNCLIGVHYTLMSLESVLNRSRVLHPYF